MTQRVTAAWCPHDGEVLQYSPATGRHSCPCCTYSARDLDLYDNLLLMRRFPSKEERRCPSKEEKKCECGVDSVGGGKHSKWCPLYTEDDE